MTDMIEVVKAALKESMFDRGIRVYEWPDDEAAAYRDNGGFSEGTEAAEEIRFTKAAKAVLEALEGGAA
ncbi:hypothetical protein [Arthrobacter sp. MDT1-65]